MISRILITATFVLTSYWVFGQSPAVSLPVINPPSANATSLGIYGEYPVSLSTGTVDVSVPLYEIQSSRLKVPISTSCHTNGIKVHEMASCVGLGWTLNAGGAIVRQVNDLSDFELNGFYNIVVPEENDPIQDNRDYFAGRITTANKDLKYDSQPDEFNYSFPSGAGKFMFRNRLAGNVSPGATTIPYSNTNISYQNDQFMLTTDNGIRYVYGKSLAGAAAMETTRTNASGIIYPANVTAWYLTEIIAADNTDTIFFKYSQPASYSLTYQAYTLNVPYANSGMPGFPTRSYSTSQVANSYINLMEIAFRNGSVTFEYEDRTDIGSKRLKAVHVYQKTGASLTELKRFNFYQSYFTSSTGSSQIWESTPSLHKRLRLDSITEQGFDMLTAAGVTKKPYVFSYFTGPANQEIPYLGSYAQDLWGYGNGRLLGAGSDEDLLFARPDPQSPIRAPNPKLGADRKPNYAYLVRGTLKGITYPTGGKTTFEFEPNETFRDWTEEVRDSSGQGIHISTFYMYPGSGTTGIDERFVSEKSVSNARLRVAAYKICTPSSSDPNCVYNDPTINFYDVTTNTLIRGISLGGLMGSGNSVTHEETVSLIQGHTYRLMFPTPGTITRDLQRTQYRIEGNLSYLVFDSIRYVEHTEQILTGGLRVKRITNTDIDNKTIGVKRYNYLEPYYINRVFTGDFEALADSYNFLKWQLAPGVVEVPYIKTYTENLSVPLAGGSNGSQAYKIVEEYSEDASGNNNGKTVYEFNEIRDELPEVFSLAKMNMAWKRSQAIRKRIYKKQNDTYVPVQGIGTIYEDLFPQQQDTIRFFIVHRSYSIDDFSGDPVNKLTDGQVGSLLGKEFEGNINGKEVWNGNKYWLAHFNFIIPKNVQSVVVDTLYDTNGSNPVTTETRYSYNHPVHLLPSRIEVTKSNGDKYNVIKKYVGDYNVNTCNNGACYQAFRNALNNIKKDYYNNRMLPVFQQYAQYRARRHSIYVSCAYPPAGQTTPECYDANNIFQYDSQILQLYQQFGSLKNEMNTAIQQKVNEYNQCNTSYNTCFNNLFSTASGENKGILYAQKSNSQFPVEEHNTVKSSSGEYIVGGSRTDYSYLNNKMAKPFYTSRVEPAQKLLYSDYLAQPATYLKKEIDFDRYDAFGELNQYTKRGGDRAAVKWGYNNSFPVAIVTNAAVDEVAVTSFETPETGGWTYAGAPVTLQGSPTGNKCYSLAAGAISKPGLLSANTYIVTYWTRNTTPYTIAGTQTGYPLKGRTANGWTYYSHRVTGVTSVNISGTGNLDELRLYPATAAVSSATYEPLLGVTSQCDSKDQITYYEYDGLGRLKLIRDQDGRILKQHDYQYQVPLTQ